jgi:carbon storage regulator CsrA
MLVLSRKPGEKILIGRDITVTVLEAKGNRIRIGIDAPEQIPVVRSELNEFLLPPVRQTTETNLPCTSAL